MRVHLKTLGCRLNEAELETWSRDFRAQGHELCAEADDADLVVVNTCAVTGEAVRKSRKLVRQAHRRNPRAKLVVSGCQASLDPTATAGIPGVDLVVPNPDKDRLVEIASRELDLLAMPELATEPGENTLLARGRQRAFIKVQDGCRYRCSFCIVTLARGEERSRPVEDIVAEVNRLHDEGIHEVVLAGVHLGGYGSDRDGDLQQLVRAVLADTDIPRLRLGSLEPWELPAGFWGLFDDTRLMPHLHLPLQSGADSVLRRMARRCRREDFRELVQQARAAVPDFNITTDIIVGFPGETDDEWRQTLDFVEEMGFGHLHIFAFSPRQGTKAAGLPDPVSRELKQERSQQLHELGARLKRELLERQAGRTFEVLVEGRGEVGEGTRKWAGYSPNYLRLQFTTPPELDLENRIVRVTAEGIGGDGESLAGRLDDLLPQ